MNNKNSHEITVIRVHHKTAASCIIRSLLCGPNEYRGYQRQECHLGAIYRILWHVSCFDYSRLCTYQDCYSMGKPGYFKSDEWFESEAYRIYLEEKAAGNA